MTRLTGITPTPQQFADAWAEEFGAVVQEAAGADGRLSMATARRIAMRAGPEFLISDNLMNFLDATGQKTVGAVKFIREARDYVERMAVEVAGPNQLLSLVEARNLPEDLQADFFYLRGKGLPDHMSMEEMSDRAKRIVLEAFADWSLAALSEVPGQVRGEREIASVPHPDDSNTTAHVYVARSKVWVSIGKTASASSDTPAVAWYDLGLFPLSE